MPQIKWARRDYSRDRCSIKLDLKSGMDMRLDLIIEWDDDHLEGDNRMIIVHRGLNPARLTNFR